MQRANFMMTVNAKFTLHMIAMVQSRIFCHVGGLKSRHMRFATAMSGSARMVPDVSDQTKYQNLVFVRS